MTIEIVTPALAALSRLLAYPTEELRADLDKVEDALADAPGRDRLQTLIADLHASDLYELQERYVGLFDRTRRLSLNMFEHVHGESRDRGQAMVDLAALYESAGLEICARELPDFLPLFLEFLATRPLAEAREHLSAAAEVIGALEARLDERRSPYAAVFAAARAFTGAAEATRADETAEPGDLDAAWEEEAVRFGAGAAKDDCAVDRLRTQVRAGRRDARRLEA